MPPKEQAVELAKTLDKAAVNLGVDFIGGFSALVHKGVTKGDHTLLDALPEALSVTNRVCASVSVGTQLRPALIWTLLDRWALL